MVMVYSQALRVARLVADSTPHRRMDVLQAVLGAVGEGFTLTREPQPDDLRDEVTLAAFIRLNSRNRKEATWTSIPVATTV